MREIMKKAVFAFLICLGLLVNYQTKAQSLGKEPLPKIEKNNTILQLKVIGMHCQAGCANGIDAMLKEQEGVVKSTTLFDTSSSEIEYNDKIISENEIINLIKERGFKAKKKSDPKKRDQ